MGFIKKIIFAILCFIILSNYSVNSGFAGHDVTQKDIKNAMLSLVHILRENTEKLERHELRERQVDEFVRRNMGVIVQKFSTVELLKSHLNDLDKRIDGFEVAILQMGNLTMNVSSVLNSWNFPTKNTSDVQDHSDDFPTNFTVFGEYFKSLCLDLTHLPQNTSSQCALETTSTTPSSEDEISEPNNPYNMSMVIDKITGLEETVQTNSEHTNTLINELQQKMEINTELTNDQLNTLNKRQSIVEGIADHVLNIRKTIEYGNYQILLEVDKQLKSYCQNSNKMFTDNLLDIHDNITSNQHNISTHYLSEMHSEINQIWRQINVMNQHNIASDKTLADLYNLNKVYINETSHAIDNMETKVTDMSKKIANMDDNINFLMGKQSLITQEFNQIKVILQKTLDVIKSTPLHKLNEN